LIAHKMRIPRAVLHFLAQIPRPFSQSGRFEWST